MFSARLMIQRPVVDEGIGTIGHQHMQMNVQIQREATEEAGCAITELIPIHEYLANPGACSERVSLYCGRVDSEHVGGIHGLAAEGESG